MAAIQRMHRCLQAAGTFSFSSMLEVEQVITVASSLSIKDAASVRPYSWRQGGYMYFEIADVLLVQFLRAVLLGVWSSSVQRASWFCACATLSCHISHIVQFLESVGKT